MITLRRSSDRGYFDHGWLRTHHTFSFGDYYDPRHMGFRALRVINDDVVRHGRGFPTHPHKDMEIITYILSGQLAHKDSTGNAQTIRPGEVQRMSAGKGILHSEYNPSDTEPVHLMQIWIEPNTRGIEPEYEQRTLPGGGAFALAASGDGERDSMKIHADARIFAGKLAPGESREIELRYPAAYIHVATGRSKVGDTELAAGDGAAITNQHRVDISAIEESDILLFDLK